MKHILKTLALLPGLLLLSFAALTLLGLAVVRDATPLGAALGSFLLLTLPLVGIASLPRRRDLALLLGIHLWPALVLMGIPIYFPGERGEAMARGLALVASPVQGLVPRAKVRALAFLIDAWLVEPRSRRPTPDAVAVPDEVLPAPLRPLEQEEVALPYEGRGHTLQLPVTIEGPSGRAADVMMIFDTGATYSTLDRETLLRLGYGFTADSPRISSQTANGEIQSPLVIVDRLWLGGMEVDGVTVALCDECASDAYVGLLGLNVTHRFLVTLDTARQEMLLRPRQDSRLRTLDIAPWLSLEARTMSWPDGRVEVAVKGRNLSARRLLSADVDVGCDEAAWRVGLGEIRPGVEAESRVTLPDSPACGALRMNLATATW